MSNDDLKCLSAVEFSLVEEAGIRITAVKLEKTAMAAEVRDGVGVGESECCVTVDSETEWNTFHS